MRDILTTDNLPNRAHVSALRGHRDEARVGGTFPLQPHPGRIQVLGSDLLYSERAIGATNLRGGRAFMPGWHL
jgi:hypothetical protein